MRSAVLVEINKPLIIKEVDPTPLKTGQVLVKVHMSGLCGSQLQELNGEKGNGKFVPHLMGHEGSGTVQEIGPGVTTISPGDKVVMHWRIGSGIESDFPKYILDGKEISSGKVNTLTEYSIVSENRITKVPSDTPDELCALLGCGLTTALGVIDNEIDLKLGETVLILGCGGVGLNLIQGAKLKGAGKIYGIDIKEEKRELVTKLGATFLNAHFNEFLDKHVADVIIDTTGNTNLIGSSISLLNDKGRYILVGQFKSDLFLKIPNAMNLFGKNGKTIKATQGGATNPVEDIPRYINLYNEGLLNIDEIITHEFKLDDINKAFELLKKGKAGRIMIKL